MTKVFNVVTRQLDGTPFIEDGTKNELTVGRAVEVALQYGFPDEIDITINEKFKRFLLAQRIHDAGSTPTEVSAEDVVLMETLVAKMYSIPVFGFVRQFLNADGPIARGPAGPQGIVPK